MLLFLIILQVYVFLLDTGNMSGDVTDFPIMEKYKNNKKKCTNLTKYPDLLDDTILTGNTRIDENEEVSVIEELVTSEQQTDEGNF